MAIAKQIEGFQDYYVSSAGNVWREKNNEFYLRLKPNSQYQVVLCANGQMKQMRVHRLVAMAFVPVPNKYADIQIDELEVHHINFNHFDNRASNLQWLTKTEHKKLHSKSEVTSFRKSEAKKGEKNPMYDKPRPEGSGKPPKPVIQYTKEGEFIAEYASAHEASRQTKVNNRNICSCCSGNRNSAGGYKWRYAD